MRITRRTPPTTVVDSRSTPARVGEAVGTAVAGAALATSVGLPLGIVPLAAAVGAANGAVSGWRGIYAWRDPRGIAAFVLDNTWALLNTTTGLISNTVSQFTSGRGGYSPALSLRQDRHVYAGGMRLKKGFATTWGNVVTGAGEIDGDEARAVRRRQLVTDHEDVHVWQSRLFGPVFLVVYIGWTVIGGAVGIVRWAVHRDAPLGQYIESTGYYANPFEWWAYSRDAHWPPRRALATRIWRRPLVRPLRDLR